MDQPIAIAFDNSYANLPNHFYTRQQPTPVAKPQLIKLNEALADQLGLSVPQLRTENGIAMFSGNAMPEGADPLAMAYAGHQFGNWVPQLGDGRAVLLGEVVDHHGVRHDIQLKGAGPTPYSRNGDGRAAVGPVVREFVVSEAMAALGVPTTRALCAVTTGESVYRESVLPGAILTRVALSHVRVGTFQYFAARGNHDALSELTDYVIKRHYPDVAEADNPPLALLEAVLIKQAGLMAKWQSIGFIHGVMNTDNASVAGLTIDYGPCAFMDAYDPETVFSSIDHMGRYAYQNQPGIAQWNMANLAQCLLPLIDADEQKALAAAQSVIDAFPTRFTTAYLAEFRKKLGLQTEHSDDAGLVDSLLGIMSDQKADFTNTFRALSNTPVNTVEQQCGQQGFLNQFSNSDEAALWSERWWQRHEHEPDDVDTRQRLMQNNNPAYIARNHRVEEVIVAAQQHNYEPMNTLVDVLSAPFTESEQNVDFQSPPTEAEKVRATFCGT